jgi:hypothetical protein
MAHVSKEVPQRKAEEVLNGKPKESSQRNRKKLSTKAEIALNERAHVPKGSQYSERSASKWYE